MVYGRSIAIGGCLLLLVITLSALIFYLSLGPCPQGTFACDGNTLCVPQRQICDNRTDCDDGSDEHPVECGLLYGSKALTDKIVGNAIERRRQQQRQKQQQQSKIFSSGHNGTATELINVTTVGVTPLGQATIDTENGGRSTQVSDNDTVCEITTYPKGVCTCRQRTLLYCGRKAKLIRIPRLSAEVTHLMIGRSNLTLRENSFTGLKHLQKLSLKHCNISHVPLGTFNGLHQLEKLDVRHNNISTLAVGIFRGMNSLVWLFLISNQLRQLPLAQFVDMPRLEWLMLSDNLLTLRNEKFPHMQRLYEIYLDSNAIEYISEDMFANLATLNLLNLNDNRITHIHPRAFWSLHDIRDIRLIGNPLKELSGEVFLRSSCLEALSLSHTPLYISHQLVGYLNISYLNLTGIPFERIDFEAINLMSNLKYIEFDRFYFCSMTPQLRMCKPNSDGVSSFRDLLSKPVLRYSAWIMAFVTVVGNIMVLWGRFIYRDENIAVTMVIRNLALADILMGFYLITIGVQDYRYRSEYYKVALDWITSWQCAAIGSLAVTSSEVSMLILAFMSFERFLLIADPFRSQHRIGIKNIFIALLAIWLMGVGIAVAPVALWHSSTKFYGTYSGTCFPLHIQEPYPLGWQYSAFIFLGVNLFLLLMIALLYTALLISIWRTRKATPLSLLDCEFAVRFFFIVLTDVLCWAPIIAMKIWVFFNYNISDDIYAWLVVFILPLNSAVNPLLYTFTTPKYRNQILLRGWKKITSRRRADPSNGLATTIATATASSNPDESSSKAIPLTVNH
ncbi:relaxin receptor 2 [Zeugodacus cucurbitae]|uniref:relaxin receptor 2 n=1 Tax=Zeugodacus cucurbitae TaxID=28588 RepID=UPI0023D947A7|nr:relaxin receptor 2 [Zeugodacus cucurbitae]